MLLGYAKIDRRDSMMFAAIQQVIQKDSESSFLPTFSHSCFNCKKISINWEIVQPLRYY